jgi:hypothetical protein
MTSLYQLVTLPGHNLAGLTRRWPCTAVTPLKNLPVSDIMVHPYPHTRCTSSSNFCKVMALCILAGQTVSQCVQAAMCVQALRALLCSMFLRNLPTLLQRDKQNFLTRDMACLANTGERHFTDWPPWASRSCTTNNSWA